MSIPTPRPGTHWYKQSMLAIFTFIEESNPSFIEIKDVGILQLGMKDSTFQNHWDTWLMNGYVYKNQSKEWEVRKGVIDMIKAGLPMKFGGSKEQEEPTKKPSKKEKKAKVEEIDLGRFEQWKTRTDLISDNGSPFPFSAWSKKDWLNKRMEQPNNKTFWTPLEIGFNKGKEDEEEDEKEIGAV